MDIALVSLFYRSYSIVFLIRAFLPKLQAIHGFRETERQHWSGVCADVVERLRAAAFPGKSPLLGPVHVLDLDKSGFIKPHVDSVKVCSSAPALPSASLLPCYESC